MVSSCEVLFQEKLVCWYSLYKALHHQVLSKKATDPELKLTHTMRANAYLSNICASGDGEKFLKDLEAVIIQTFDGVGRHYYVYLEDPFEQEEIPEELHCLNSCYCALISRKNFLQERDKRKNDKNYIKSVQYLDEAVSCSDCFYTLACLKKALEDFSSKINSLPYGCDSLYSYSAFKADRSEPYPFCRAFDELLEEDFDIHNGFRRIEGCKKKSKEFQKDKNSKEETLDLFLSRTFSTPTIPKHISIFEDSLDLPMDSGQGDDMEDLFPVTPEGEDESEGPVLEVCSSEDSTIEVETEKEEQTHRQDGSLNDVDIVSFSIRENRCITPARREDKKQENSREFEEKIDEKLKVLANVSVKSREAANQSELFKDGFGDNKENSQFSRSTYDRDVPKRLYEVLRTILT